MSLAAPSGGSSLAGTEKGARGGQAGGEGDGSAGGPVSLRAAGGEDVQRLCSALLAHAFGDVRCYPVGHSDGGRDATLRNGGRSAVYQVKWTSKPAQNPVAWLKAAIDGESDTIRRLVKEGVEAYYLLTSVAGTAVPRRGSMDTLDIALAEYERQFGIPVRIWWRADIDARVDSALAELKWAYSDMLAGQDLRAGAVVSPTVRLLMRPYATTISACCPRGLGHQTAFHMPAPNPEHSTTTP